MVWHDSVLYSVSILAKVKSTVTALVDVHITLFFNDRKENTAYAVSIAGHTL